MSTPRAFKRAAIEAKREPEKATSFKMPILEHHTTQESDDVTGARVAPCARAERTRFVNKVTQL